MGLYSESGCGKTWSSLLLARGFVGPEGKIGMIETESGRGEAYADLLPGGYEVLPLRETFAPSSYGQALTAAEEAKLDALIIDSASHEWEGAGGVLALAAARQASGMKGVLVWQQPKMEHQRHFMLRLMQTPIPLVIVCMRAKYPMIEKKKPGSEAKEWVRSEVLEPKQADDILFEMFVHGWIDREHRLHVTKYTRPDLAQIIRDNEPITLETGQRLAAWSKEAASEPPKPTEAPQHEWDDYVALWEGIVDEATDAAELARAWNSDGHKAARKAINWPEGKRQALADAVSAKVTALKEQAQA